MHCRKCWDCGKGGKGGSSEVPGSEAKTGVDATSWRVGSCTLLHRGAHLQRAVALWLRGRWPPERGGRTIWPPWAWLSASSRQRHVPSPQTGPRRQLRSARQPEHPRHAPFLQTSQTMEDGAQITRPIHSGAPPPSIRHHHAPFLHLLSTHLSRMWAGSGPARSSNVAHSYAAKLHALWLCEPGVRHADRMAPSLRAAFDDARISSSVFRCSCFEVLDLPAALPGAEPIKAPGKSSSKSSCRTFAAAMALNSLATKN